MDIADKIRAEIATHENELQKLRTALAVIDQLSGKPAKSPPLIVIKGISAQEPEAAKQAASSRARSLAQKKLKEERDSRPINPATGKPFSILDLTKQHFEKHRGIWFTIGDIRKAVPGGAKNTVYSTLDQLRRSNWIETDANKRVRLAPLVVPDVEHEQILEAAE